jgi:hypothetical protein
VSRVVPCKATLPAKVSKPEVVDTPNPRLPLIAAGLLKVRATAESLETVPPASFKTPAPAAAFAPNNNTPLLTLNPPVKVLVPPKVNVAAPIFTSAPEPLITPPKLDAPAPLKVRVLPARFTEPSPAKVPTSSPALKFRAAPVFTVSATPFASALPPTKVRLPALTVVVPLKVFTPAKVNSAVPDFTNPPFPPNDPVNVAALASVIVLAPMSVPPPLKVRLPEFTASPRVKVPESNIAFESVRAAAESLESRPPPRFKVPLPSAALFPS